MTHILVIDDDRMTQRLLQRLLQGQGYIVTIAQNGSDGLALAEQIDPALIVCDWVLPGSTNGLDVCRGVKNNPDLATTFFLLLTARDSSADRVKGLDAGADDLLTKPVDINELKARVRAGLRFHQLTRDLKTQKQLLEAELTEAADYVRSLLPTNLEGKVPIEACFIPSRQLGGDCFDYYWLDPDYLVIYLLDVSGHGLGSALLSTSVLNVLRSQSLPNVNFYRPEKVLQALNETFQMDDQHDKYFTIWYGVYNYATRQLSYASAGHPPAVLVTQSGGEIKIDCLKTPGMPVGMLPDSRFIWQRTQVPPESDLYIFSDGIYEVQDPGEVAPLDLYSFVSLLGEKGTEQTIDNVLTRVKALRSEDTFPDDLSLLKIGLG
ncbi:MAG: SpoIIE family protein phosphatase [Leptolyngbyaceae cyanobacterium SL_1_1]|nr:SpoIIE family protein phosphatase [Leptolyngbyaceae cyanobacterium RM1_1_2]NJO11443.1 SpoIIE family protein phosphatase [Leptolyngbyaceae cyanobacterium SL_1_1]